MSTRPVQRARSLEQRVSSLYDFSLDISRHDGDLTFARRGGVIHYVLDENILEMFVDPSRYYHYVMTEDAGRPKRKPRPRDMQAMQSALLTAEALLSGSLPGQSKGRCFLTEWHRWEALERVSTFISTLSRSDPETLKRAMERALEVKARLAEGGDDAQEVDASFDPFLPADLSQLAAVPGVGADERAVDQFARVRRASAYLSRETDSEPLHQVNRVLKADAEGLLTAVTELRLPDGREQERLAVVAQEWARRIRSEARTRAAKRNSPKVKSKTATWNDAQSIALLEWISRRLDPDKERLVFVTGDPTIFDCYRRWYEPGPGERSRPPGPFILRRPVQYTALFSSNPRGLSEARQQLFYSLQQLVELPLAPIRMASVVGDGDMSADDVFRRHSLTLDRMQVNDRSIYFHEVFGALGKAYNPDQIEAVEDQIATTERLLSGLSGDLVERRIAPEQRELLRVTRGDEAERERLIARYVGNAVDELIRSALQVWRPEAEIFFRRAAMEGPKRSGRHVPLAVNPTAGSSLAAMLDALFEDPVEEGSGSRPVRFQVASTFDIFLGAAAVAIHGNQWRLGDHFCEVAINAFNYLSRVEASTRGEVGEAYYLSALAKRFRLGELRVQPDNVGHAQAARLYEAALVLLSKSEEFAAGAPPGFGSYRAYSERAALSLFYAVVCAIAARPNRDTDRPRYKKFRASAAGAFADAGAFLSEALRVERRFHAEAPMPDNYGSPAERVRLQILINIAAWHAIRPLIRAELDVPTRPDLARELLRNLQLVERVVGKIGSPLFEAELTAFKISQGVESSRSRQRLENMHGQRRRGQVDVDHLLLRQIKELWGGTSRNEPRVSS